MFLKNKNIIFKIRISKVTDYAALNILDPDQAQHFVGPDLGPNCLQRLSADYTNRQRVDNS